MKSIYFLLICSLLAILTSCQKESKPTLKVAATAIPHAEILEFIKPELEKEGINLQIITVEDYNTPNRALQDKEVDANFFQHRPFLEMQMQDFGYQLEGLATIHIEPMALYSKKIKTIKNINLKSTVAIPSDPSNQARALCLLQEIGLITLNRCDVKTSLLDLKQNSNQLQFIEIDSPLLARALDDVDLAAITTNFALQAGLSPQTDALAMENGRSLFSNILVIRAGEANRPELIKLKVILTSPKVKEFINEHYQGSVTPAF